MVVGWDSRLDLMEFRVLDRADVGPDIIVAFEPSVSEFVQENTFNRIMIRLGTQSVDCI